VGIAAKREGLDKIMGTLQIPYKFLYLYGAGPFLPSIQPQSFCRWDRTRFRQSLPEFYTILLEEHLKVDLEILEVGMCSSL
jgi:hypothetical protein